MRINGDPSLAFGALNLVPNLLLRLGKDLPRRDRRGASLRGVAGGRLVCDGGLLEQEAAGCGRVRHRGPATRVGCGRRCGARLEMRQRAYFLGLLYQSTSTKIIWTQSVFWCKTSKVTVVGVGSCAVRSEVSAATLAGHDGLRFRETGS